ncbi:hypothetical protein C8Q73DRAFT_787169 [Cubamyces lactineus]|nr:hypothetical protein C8Q73DRAFT_787169 [Cubamyces lactineus]
MVVYNWLINLGDEINLFCSAPTKGVSLLYFAIRYMAFVDPTLAMFTFYPMADKVRFDYDHCCEAVYWTSAIVGPIVFIAPAIFSANRAYALSEQSRLIYCAVLILSLGPFFANLIDNIVWTKPLNLPPPVLCSEQDNTPPSANLLPISSLNVMTAYNLCPTVLLFSRLSVTVADLIVLVVTWRATYKVLRETRGLLKVSVTQVLLFNGAFYFIVLLLMNIAHIIMTELSITDFTEATSYLSLFIEPLMSILASDFLLNLQKATTTSSHMDSDQGQGEGPSLNFAAITQTSHTETAIADADADVDADGDDFGEPEA